MPLFFILSQVAGVGDLYEDPLLQDRTDLHIRPADTWKVKLAKCGGFCMESSGKGFPPKSNISPPSMSQSCGGAEGTGKRGTRQCHPKYFVSTPSISSGSPRVQTVKVTLGPLKKMEHFSSQVGTTQRSTLTWIFLLD